MVLELHTVFVLTEKLGNEKGYCEVSYILKSISFHL